MDVKNEMIHNYCSGLRVEEGRKYYKLIGSNGGGTQESVKGFIVKEDSSFKKLDGENMDSPSL